MKDHPGDRDPTPLAPATTTTQPSVNMPAPQSQRTPRRSIAASARTRSPPAWARARRAQSQSPLQALTKRRRSSTWSKQRGRDSSRQARSHVRQIERTELHRGQDCSMSVSRFDLRGRRPSRSRSRPAPALGRASPWRPRAPPGGGRYAPPRTVGHGVGGGRWLVRPRADPAQRNRATAPRSAVAPAE